MSAMTVLQVPDDGWTTDDLPDVEFGYELVDGALLVTPPPELRHDVIADDLPMLLRPILPGGWSTLLDRGVHFDLRNYREPDLVVYRRAAVTSARLSPRDVLLAVEVVSPTSRASDRIAKPAQYAEAGIQHYWRIEQDPLEMITYELSADVYVETGRFDDEVVLSHPWALTFRLGDLGQP